MVIKSPRFPEPGETILGGDFFMFQGGKGANQAVAAARLGAKVDFICSLGDDVFGQNALAHYRQEGLEVSGAQVHKGMASGVAMINVNGEGENQIIVASGSNTALSPSILEQERLRLEVADLILTQLETPLESVAYLAEHFGQKLILNPAPAQELPRELLSKLWLITPNETEAALLTGQALRDAQSTQDAAKSLLDMGVQNVILTLGAKGAMFMNAEEQWLHPTAKVSAVDTTAAGDVFNGALSVALLEGQGWRDAVDFACKAATLSVQKMGAQSSAPYRNELA
ncbi:MAG: ribokinase, partial [Bacteroidota bacterium]